MHLHIHRPDIGPDPLDRMRKSSCPISVNPHIHVIALGANLPVGTNPPASSLCKALDALSQIDGVTLAAVSRFITTPAHPPGSGPEFVNAVAQLRGEIAAEALLARCHAIEAALGRNRAGAGRWGARVIDVDLLASNGMVMPDRATFERWRDLPPDDQQRIAPDQLILPHPRIQDRPFVLIPLAEIAPEWRHPVNGMTAMQMLQRLAADQPGGA